MQLRRLRVKNIRSYEAADVEFGDGTTLIAGDVGAGKTSLLYAIEMALFGVAEVNAAYLVRHGASHAEVTVEFEGDDQRYEIFRRFRRLRRKGQETFEAERIRFTVNGAETAYSATELRQKVIELLGFPDNPSPQAHSDLWRWAVYVPQERMRDILGARPQDRLETVRKALGVERYRTAAENAQDLATDLRRSASSRRAEADRLRHYEEQLAEGSRQADRLQVERVAAERALREDEAAFSDLEAARAEREGKIRTAEADERELAGLEREQKADQRSIEEQLRLRSEQEADSSRLRDESLAVAVDADTLDIRRTALAAAEEAVARVRAELEGETLRLRSLSEARALMQSAEREEGNARVAAEQSRIVEEEARKVDDQAFAEGPEQEPLPPTPEDLPTLDAHLAEARRRETECLQAVTQAESSLAEVEELLRAGVCPRCHQSVHPDEFATHRTEATAAVEAARARLRVAGEDRARGEARRKAREEYERAADRYREIGKRRATTRAALLRAAGGLEEAERARDASERAVIAARQRVADLLPGEARETALREELVRAEEVAAHRARDVQASVVAQERRRGLERTLDGLKAQGERSEREAALLRKRLADRERRVTSLRATVGEAEALRAAAAEGLRSLKTAQHRLDAERKALGSLESQLEEAGHRIREAEIRCRERAELLAEATDIEEKATWIGTAFRSALLGMEQKLLTHAQALFEREFARYFGSLLDDPGLVARTDPTFTPNVLIEGEWTPAEALSGGERTSLALAFRLALAHVVRSMGSLHLDTILLDEPTDGFSPEQVIRMGELLEELALPQVIIVSHESQLASIADRVVRVQKVDGRSILRGSRSGDIDSVPSSGPPRSPSLAE